MANYTKETVTTQDNNNSPVVNAPDKKEATGSQTFEYFIYFLLGILEILLAFRFVFKLAGANPTSGFVNFIYGLSRIFVSPFAGIFHTSLAQGSETTSFFEPSTLIAIIVYALLAWGIVKLLSVLSGEKQQAD